MITSKHIEDFISTNYSSFLGPELNTNGSIKSEKKLQYVRIENPLIKVAKYESELDKPFEQFNQNDFITLFEKNNWTAKNTFVSNKSVVKEFAEWYFENVIGLENIPFGHSKKSPVEYVKLKDISSETRYQKEYFKNHADFLNALNEVFGEEDKYSIHKAFFALMWYGINRNQMRQLKQEDFNTSTGSLVIQLGDKSIEVEDNQTIGIIQHSFQTDGFESEINPFGRGLIEASYQYQPTEMFLRKSIRQNEDFTDLEERELKYRKVPESIINRYFTDQTKLADELPEGNDYRGKHMVFRGISDSAAFCRLIEKGRKANITKDEIDEARMDNRDSQAIVDAFNSNFEGWQKHFGYA